MGYTSTDEGTHAVFYGGQLQDNKLGGLFKVDLDPGSLLGGQDVEHLDDGLAVTPGERSHAVLAYQAWEAAIYLFGGEGPDGPRRDLWRFSLKSNTWTLVSDGTEPDAPPSTVPAGIVVSPLDGSVVVIAGTVTPGVQERAWRYHGGQWSPVTQWQQ